MASHEFRTPLTVIDGHAQRLIKLSNCLKAGEIAERAGRVRGAVLRMTNLIDNLLDSSRLMDGGGGLYFDPIPIDLVIVCTRSATCIERLRPDRRSQRSSERESCC
jgi:two-component system, OmpR family, sensor kinase